MAPSKEKFKSPFSEALNLKRRSVKPETYQASIPSNQPKQKRKQSLDKTSKLSTTSPPSKKARNNAYQECVIVPAGDLVIWGKCKGHGMWPGRIAKESELDGDPEKPGDPTRWVQWFGDFKFSETKVWEMFYFHIDLHEYFRPSAFDSNRLYRKAVVEAITYIAKKLGKECDGQHPDKLLEWARKGFKPYNISDLTPKPIEIIGSSSEVEEDEDDDEDYDHNWEKEDYFEERSAAIKKVRSGMKNLEDVCLGCGTHQVKIPHPLFVGGLCEDCENDFREIIYLLDETSGAYCCMCGEGKKIVLCDKLGCCKSFCTFCMWLLTGPEEYEKEMEEEPWTCFLCRDTTKHGLISRREGWQQKLCSYLSSDDDKTQNFDVVDIPRVVATKKRSVIRVLSLFDGIASGLVALKEIGLRVDVYFASEIEPDANMIVKNHHPEACHIGDVRNITDSMLSRLGPFDLLIGGSPCNDLSIVNPARKGIWGGTGQLFFEFVRILNTCRLLACQNNRNFFWLFENVVCMDRASRVVIDRFLQRKGVMLDAKNVSPARRPRYFWGNLPGMSRPLLSTSSHRLDLNECLQPGRVSAAKKIRTITTRTNSVPRDLIKFQHQPHHQFKLDAPICNSAHMPDNAPDRLWITEIERVFGFPDHYTDVGDLSATNRLKVIGKSWSVPVIKHLFTPLKEFFLSRGETAPQQQDNDDDDRKDDEDAKVEARVEIEKVEEATEKKNNGSVKKSKKRSRRGKKRSRKSKGEQKKKESGDEKEDECNGGSSNSPSSESVVEASEEIKATLDEENEDDVQLSIASSTTNEDGENSSDDINDDAASF